MLQKIRSLMQKLVLFDQRVHQAKTLSELMACVSMVALEQMAFVILMVCSLAPVLAIIQNLLAKPDDEISLAKDLILLNWLTILRIAGNLGLILSVIAFIKSIVIFQSSGQKLRQYLRDHFTLVAMGFMLFWSILSTLVSDYPETAFWGSIYRQEGLITILAYAGIFGAAVLIKQSNHLVRILTVFGLTGFLVTLHYLYDFFFLDSLFPAGIFYNYNHTAYYLLILLFSIISVFFSSRQSRRNSVIWLCLISFFIFALIFNNSLGPYLAAISGFFFLYAAIQIRPTDQLVKKQLLLITAIFVLISIVSNLINQKIFMNFFQLSEDVSRIAANEASSDYAGSGRWILWKVGLKLILERPWLGFGPDSLALPYAKYGITYLERPHNEFMYYAASMGLPALFFYLSALGCYFRLAWQSIKILSWLQLGLVVTISSYLVSSFFGNTMFYTVPYFLIIFGLSYQSIRQSQAA